MGSTPTLSVILRTMSRSVRLKVAEGLSKVKLNVVSLPFHADPDEQPALGVQVQPELAGKVVAEVHWIQL